MPDSWKRNQSVSNTKRDENVNSNKEDSREENNRQVVSSNKLSEIGKKISSFGDSTVKFVRKHVIPSLPLIAAGVCMYGVAVASPHVARVVSEVAEKGSKATGMWVTSLLERSTTRKSDPSLNHKPSQTRPDDNSNNNNNNHNNNKNSQRSPEERIKVIPLPNSKLKVVELPSKASGKQSQNKRRVDLEALASAQHLSLWEVIRFRAEMVKRSFY